ncbi:T9SS type A sorting domain-containing protein [bacterium]|nr:T9SS type A sorting domain-containing protein [bacterium]
MINIKSVKGDLDGDGDIDLILNGTGGSQTYFNDGLGNYSNSNNGLVSGWYHSIELGDVDGDGDLDCLLSGEVSNSQNKTALMLNDGNGNFTLSQAIFPSVYFSDAIFGDVDGDSDLDIFLTGKGVNGGIHSELYLNDGSGNFSIDINNTFVLLQSSDAVFFDIDNDSDLDIVYSGENVSNQKHTLIYLNNGFGGFKMDSLNVLLGASSAKLEATDVDNDGDIDLFVLDSKFQNGSSVVLYLNNGNGYMVLDSINNFPNLSFGNISLVDLNMDNQMDVILTGREGNLSTTQVFKNMGNGQFLKDTLVALVDVHLGSVVPINLNTDSFVDLLIMGDQSGSGGRITSTYLNDQNGNFYKKSASFNVGLVWGVAIHSDIDGDLDEDLFMTGRDENNIPQSFLYKNDGNGNFQLTNSSIIGVMQGESIFTDIDQDSDVDLVISGKDVNDVLKTKIYLNDGLGNFQEDTINSLKGVFHSSIAVADFNNDGQQDILISGSIRHDSSITRLYFGSNNGIYSLDTTFKMKDLGYGSVSVADIDGDSDIDVFISGEGVDSNSVWNWGRFSILYINDGLGNFSKATNNQYLKQVSGGVSEFADLDNDGDYDLVYTGTDNSICRGVFVHFNDGLGGFSSPVVYNGNVYRYQQVLSDFDNDNDLDLILNTHNDITLFVYQNDSLGSFSKNPNQDIQFSVFGGSAYFDMDGDNDIDLLFTGTSIFSAHGTFVYRNNLISKVGLEELKETKEYKLVPNPTNGAIAITDDYQEIKSVEVYSINGQLIFSNELTQSLSHQINLPDQNGIYILLIHAKDGQSAQRVVKY